ncbi:Xaa-Pro aminopeptidase [Beggiatoa leptomitoformis]|uniref:Xaa-Pro aminopeptidase n=1 Tax=Beggiatoa leptomitoformis TaxID=288004 RepID=A0A2N9YB01_9GAMM|nr:Xaa-Pro aminopeptidase [Beggiatoa leptomitoformis]ALG67005.1 Xaa-Pro aminopeptidase [Beggiatoa leptomitoformis]AUI67622.1 Xaa-Pro aminopeptidase [Beggiatoa leptomitoformis]
MDKQEFARRRQALMNLMSKGSIALLPTALEQIRNRDVHFPYRPDSNFYYLTGFTEPDALLVLIPERKQGQYLLFCRERDPEKETWNGRRAGLEGACEHYGADDAFPITDIDDIIPGLLESCKRVYYPMGCYLEFDEKVLGWINQLRDKSRTGVNAPREMVALDHILHEMRLYKSPVELQAMQTAADIASRAHIRAMQCTRAGLYEYEIEAELQHEFRRSGSSSPAYPSIVGTGENSCILHYTENTSILKEGDLLLIDAGAEYDYYASDITRTFPVNGKFTDAQKAIYELVLKAQYAAIEQARPNNNWEAPHEAAVKVIATGLVELGLLKGTAEEQIKSEGYKRFFMHRTGHWIGMDVHDVGDYKTDELWRRLEPGMTLTVEPGIYIPVSDDVDPKWWNIGIRIEDDVLITAEGHLVLTAKTPKTVAEIEALVGTGA